MHVIESGKVDGLINHYNWMVKFLPQYNQDNEAAVTISRLSQHYEHGINYKEYMSKDEFESWKSSKYYEPQRIKGETMIFYRATFEVTANSKKEWIWLGTDNPHEYPEIGAEDVTPNLLDDEEKRYQDIQFYKFDKTLETDFEISFIDMPDPTKEELEAYKLKIQQEKDEKIKKIRESWK